MHGIAADDALHAWAFAVDAFTVDGGMVMYIGPTELGTCSRSVSSSGTTSWPLALVHAMPARPKFVR